MDVSEPLISLRAPATPGPHRPQLTGSGGVLLWIFAVTKAVWVFPAVLSTIPLAVFAFPILTEVVITLGRFVMVRT